MAEPSRTSPRELEEAWKMGFVPPPAEAPRPSLLSRLWTWTKEDLFGEPYEPPIGDDQVLRRIRIAEKATAGARKLRRLPPEDAAQILIETAVLLGFPDARTLAPRRRVPR
ncbi:MAG: hypothetical protein PHS14_16930 [Elusimicrobia bacterium]|nr:hypothetical protein [Elusimicrobiota bacterium]